MSGGYRAAEDARRRDAREAYRGADGATGRSTLEVSISIRTVLLVVVQAVSGAVQALSGDVPHILDKVRQSGLGSLIDDRSGAFEALRRHARDITSGVGRVSAGVAHVGVSAFEAITLAVSIVVLTHLGLVDEPRVRHRMGSLLFRDDRERPLRVTDRIIQTTSRYMLGNLPYPWSAGPSTA